MAGFLKGSGSSNSLQPVNLASVLPNLQMPQQMQGSALRGLSNGLSGLQGLLGKL